MFATSTILAQQYAVRSLQCATAMNTVLALAIIASQEIIINLINVIPPVRNATTYSIVTASHHLVTRQSLRPFQYPNKQNAKRMATFEIASR
jgi:hypothetical protein